LSKGLDFFFKKCFAFLGCGQKYLDLPAGKGRLGGGACPYTCVGGDAPFIGLLLLGFIEFYIKKNENRKIQKTKREIAK
jgi:hypothetical protein